MGETFKFLSRISFVCKFQHYFYYTFESFGQWLMVAFNIERVIAIYFPFQAKQMLSATFSNISILITFIFSLLVSIPVYFSRELRPTDLYGNYNCQSVGMSQLLAYLMVFIATGQKYPYSTTSILVLTFALAIKIIRNSKSRLKIFGHSLTYLQSQTPEALNTKDVNAALILILMSVFQCVIYFAGCIIWETVYLNNAYTFLSKSDALVWQTVGNIYDIIKILVRFMNLFVFLIKSAVFREECIKLFTCRLSCHPLPPASLS